jgi:hypothetical protein
LKSYALRIAAKVIFQCRSDDRSSSIDFKDNPRPAVYWPPDDNLESRPQEEIRQDIDLATPEKRVARARPNKPLVWGKIWTPLHQISFTLSRTNK